ncbi:MAG: UDP-N-acetylmuramoyl-L-alanyl-D-glutamate--2,6-diaminopimelate ligase [Bdellovibrionales bacterium]|nr:UDP-N-acetylmuramoyl-L-alanyl-D-glutamate--2,6-diaminopimelate ligase [Bdellovibrionales bacterium]
MNFGSFINEFSDSEVLRPQAGLEIGNVTSDARKVIPGALFVAYQGVSVDGHTYIEEAIRRGAVAIIAEHPVMVGVPQIVVSDGRAALSRAVALFWGHPSQKFPVYGVTGTNGKSTIHWLLYHLFESLIGTTLRIGTLGVYSPDIPAHTGPTTTPTAEELHELFALFRDHGGECVVMEVSSHGLAQHRVSDIAFRGAIFSNLSIDHLNFHENLEDYFAAKCLLFSHLEREAVRIRKKLPAIVCIDDLHGVRLLESLSRESLSVLGYGESPEADVRVSQFCQSESGSEFSLSWQGRTYSVQSSLIGRYNALNIAAAFGMAVAQGFDPLEVCKLIKACPHVPGRLEPVVGEGKIVFVDYAHTGDGLRNALQAVREVCRGKLWCAFGCGGGKDPRKRANMGAAAKEFADCVVLTDDNPKDEDPADIVKEILQSGVQPVFVEHDRARAIRRTIAEMNSGDVFLLAGKGHEDYQIVQGVTHHFSDIEEVRAAFSERGVSESRESL